jgi:uncharacterized membrane protein YdbT with pleckstrin-like domain
MFQKGTNEDIKIILRRHWASLMGLISFTFVMLILPIAFYFILRSFIFLSAGFFNIFVLGLGIYYMFVVTLFFIGWLDYYLDVAIITNERIMDIDQQSLFNRRESELRFSKIQDVTGSVQGILATMLDFGDVIVQTAGTQEEFILDKVPHPHRIAKLIIDLQQARLENPNSNKEPDGL